MLRRAAFPVHVIEHICCIDQYDPLSVFVIKIHLHEQLLPSTISEIRGELCVVSLWRQESVKQWTNQRVTQSQRMTLC